MSRTSQRSDWQSEVSKVGLESRRFRLFGSYWRLEARGIQKPARTLYTARVGFTLSVSREVQRILLREEVLAMIAVISCNQEHCVRKPRVREGWRLFLEVTRLTVGAPFQVTTRVEV